MRKSDKKLDNQIRVILTELCEGYYEQVNGFNWLTHVVDYNSFPNSLNVICVFDTQNDIDQFLALGNDVKVNNTVVLSLLNQQLNAIGVKVKKLDKLIRYDDEKTCSLEHNGNWTIRLNTR